MRETAEELSPVSGIVTLERATPDADRYFRDLLELYVEELSEIFPVTRAADGRFGYDRLPLYWAEPDVRHAFLIKAGSHVAGFVLVTRGSPAGDSATDLDVAEFFVLPSFRRSGVGRQAAIALWDRMPGRWVVRVLETNDAALRFWTAVIASYTSGAFVERRQPGPPHAWRIFTFASAASVES
jgi:predicted acetyltransferase